MIKLSQRLLHLADMVTEGFVLADVGTDHGYVPIYLLRERKIPRAFAMDIKKGPLLRAKEHIESFGLGDYITLRLSDGLAELSVGEADSILIAGMGGGVMLHILEEGRAAVALAKELILQPQSEIEKVRKYLYQMGYVIDREDLVFEDGKYYPMLHVNLKAERKESPFHSKEEWQMIYRYGEFFLDSENLLWQSYLLHKIGQYETIFKNLALQQGEGIRIRREEIAAELFYAKSALEYRKGGRIT